MADSTSPLDPILGEIRAALKAEYYYLAISVALSIPDICSSLEWDPDPALVKENRKFPGKRYAKWFEDYMQHHYDNLTGDDCYRLRCGVVHNAKMGRRDDPYDRVMFEIPSEQSNYNHETIMEGNVFDGNSQPDKKVLILLAVSFCEEMIAAAESWYQDKKDDAFVKANLPTLVKTNPHGIEPYTNFTGPTPVIG